jgi:hypothetical protein
LQNFGWGVVGGLKGEKSRRITESRFRMSEQEEERKSQKFVKFFLREVVCSMGLRCLVGEVGKSRFEKPKTGIVMGSKNFGKNIQQQVFAGGHPPNY